MPSRRPTPFSLVFGALALERFPLLRDTMAREGRDARDRDEFLLVREVNELMQELRPEEGLGAGVGGLGALVHSSYLFWLDGERIREIDEAALDALLARAQGGTAPPVPGSGTAYVQLPPLRVWGVPVEGANPEPLDGWYVSGRDGMLTILAIFGMHPGREGLTVAEATGGAPQDLRRADGSAPFAPTLAGGQAAGLASIEGEEELLDLAWRVEAAR